MRYHYILPSYDLGQLHEEIKAAQALTDGFIGLIGGDATVAADFLNPLSLQEKSLLDQLVQAHVPDPQAFTKRVRKLARALANDGSPQRVQLRAILKLLRLVIEQDRTYMAALRAELVALGRNPPPAPPVRTWAQLVGAVDALIDAGEGDA